MIKIIGLGPGTFEHLTNEAVVAISNSDVLVASARILEAANLSPLARYVELPASGMAQAVVDVLERESQCGEVSLLVSGDPGFYSLAKKVVEHFGRDNVNIIPGVSALQILSARIGRSWVNVVSDTLHGRELPDRDELAKKLCSAPALVVLLGSSDDAIHNIRWLAEDETLGGAWAAIGWDLGLPNELVFEAENLKDLSRCLYVGKLALLWLEMTAAGK
ncbi:MAG: precorrin-6y C5,15-methyltransferase (decarboxylating) subunit CbiE [Synergistaceae bacterium]|jgi:precorrin-6y C5,15-methyltransferase (decarboxylating) CbiE subunit|nr:precorrin-6y C5,15-methyltransferase (decarboxylating) subunit CbiE [Synergistaceae bacterium]